MFYQYPYSTLYNLNLDWIIKAIKEMQDIVAPLDRVVNSVNGLTGDVEITKALLTQILGNIVETFNGRSGEVELTAEDVNSTLIDITWTSDPGDTIGDLSQTEIDQLFLSGKRVLIFVNNFGVADQVYFLQYYEGHAQPQEYTPTSALAGVVSFNGQTGAVTATGADLATSGTDTHTIAESLQYLDEIKVPTVRTVNNKALNANIVLNDEDIPSHVVQGQTTVEDVLTYLDQRVTTQSQQIEKVEEGIAIIVDGDTASVAVPVGRYAYIKNNTHGLAEGIYKNTSSSAFPVSGGTANSTVFTAVSTGAVNDVFEVLNNKYSESGDAWENNGATVTLDLSDYKYLSVSAYQTIGNTNFFVQNTLYLKGGLLNFPIRINFYIVENLTLQLAYNSSLKTLNVSTLSTPTYEVKWRAVAHN